MNKDGAFNLYEQCVFNRLESGNIRPGGAVITDRALEICAFPPRSKLLDIGCGMGTTVRHLVYRHDMLAVGIDKSAKLLNRGRSMEPSLDLRDGDAQKLCFPSFSFDGALMECTLSLLQDTRQALLEAHRIIKPGGKLIISDFYYREPVLHFQGAGCSGLNEPCLSSDPVGASCLAGAFTVPGLFSLVRDAGFIIKAWEEWTNALKEFTAEIILKWGSLEQFWAALLSNREASTGTSDWDLSSAIGVSSHHKNLMKPGYFLMILEKPEA